MLRVQRPNFIPYNLAAEDSKVKFRIDFASNPANIIMFDNLAPPNMAVRSFLPEV